MTRIEAAPVAAVPAATSGPSPAAAGRLRPSGVLKLPHKVVVDAGHGGDDPGNPGVHLPRGLREKDVNLAVARLLRVELQRRGIAFYERLADKNGVHLDVDTPAPGVATLIGNAFIGSEALLLLGFDRRRLPIREFRVSILDHAQRSRINQNAIDPR